MSVATQPMFPGKINAMSGLLDTANTARDGTGTMLDIANSDPNGGIIERISAISAGPIATPASDNVIRMWGKLSTTYRLLAEFPIATATPSATAGGGTLPGTTTQNPWLTVNVKLQPLESVSFSIHTHAGAEDDYHVRVESGAYSLS